MPEYDAILEKWVFDGIHLHGEIREDAKKRFADGTGVRTSMVRSPNEEVKEGAVIETTNSKYKLGKPFAPAVGNREEVEAKVKEFIADFGGVDEVSDMEAPFAGMDLDSLDSVEVIMACESEWDIEIGDEEMSAILTPAMLVDKILDKIH